MAAIDDPGGCEVFNGRIAAGSTKVFKSFFVPRPGIRVSMCIYATPVPAQGAPTLTAKLRQANSRADEDETLIDRGVTPPTLDALAAEAEAIMDDDVVCNYVQGEIASANAPCDVRVVMAVR